MAKISEISPDGGTTIYDLKDKDAQTSVLSTPIEIEGTTQTTVEGALGALNNKSGGGGADLTGQDTNNIMLVTASDF